MLQLYLVPFHRYFRFALHTLNFFQTLSGVPAEVATNGSFISAIRDSLSDTVSVALDLITEVNVSQTLPDDLKLIYSITVKSCYSAGVVTNNLQTAMDTGTFVEKLLQRTGVSAAVSELEISVDIITLSPSASVVSGIVLSGPCHHLFASLPIGLIDYWTM